MTQNITTFYTPQNLNISQGKIYNFYLNKVNNLDLSSIIEQKNINLNGILQPNKEVISQPDYLQPTPQTQNNNKISISQEDYHMLLELANTSTQLYNKSQELVKRLTKGRIS